MTEMLPQAGDIGWVNFDPPFEHEQAGNRPVVVLTSYAYHSSSSLAIVCPITRSRKEWPYRVILPPGLAVEGSVILDQIKTIDRTKRGIKVVDRLPADILADMRARLAALLQIDA
jgi:mRNA-degrading endonuclease toxin of MazEF toxin-antitoxin module